MPMIVLFVLFGAASLDPLAELNSVQAAYAKAGSITADFEHIYYDSLRGKPRTEIGQLWAKQDGRVRWHYNKPIVKDFVFDGQTAFFYEPQNAQVTRFEHFADSPLSGALGFLWGQQKGDISDRFVIKTCDAKCSEVLRRQGDDKRVAVRLEPKESIQSVDHVRLLLDTQQQRIVTSMVFDPLGNRSEFRFSNVTFGKPIADKKFVFDVPPGVSEIRATGEAKTNP